MSASIPTSPSQHPLSLTDEARQALMAAQAIARAHHQTNLNTRHLLLGILEARDTYGSQTLSQFPIKLENLKTRLWAYIRLDADKAPESYGGEFYGFPLSEDGANAMAAAVQEATAQQVSFMDTRLMILGMLRRPDTYGGAILHQFDITPETFLQRAALHDPMTPPSPRRAPRIKPKAAPKLKVRRRSPLPEISPIFLLLVAIMLGLGYMLYAGIGAPGPLTFIFVLTGWILAVSFHEFGHALTAYHYGDESVAHKGYLTLDPLKYTNPLMSIIFPIIFLLMGGIPLPGGAVYINRAAIRKRWQLSLVSAAGPLATLIFGLLLLSPFIIGLSEQTMRMHSAFWQALSLLAFFQIFAFVLNLIPWPGLDGFGIIEPYLPPHILHYAYMLSGMGIFLFFLLFAYTSFGQWVGLSVWSIMQSISPDAAALAFYGFDLFFFWQK